MFVGCARGPDPPGADPDLDAGLPDAGEREEGGDPSEPEHHAPRGGQVAGPNGRVLGGCGWGVEAGGSRRLEAFGHRVVDRIGRRKRHRRARYRHTQRRDGRVGAAERCGSGDEAARCSTTTLRLPWTPRPTSVRSVDDRADSADQPRAVREAVDLLPDVERGVVHRASARCGAPSSAQAGRQPATSPTTS